MVSGHPEAKSCAGLFSRRGHHRGALGKEADAWFQGGGLRDKQEVDL